MFCPNCGTELDCSRQPLCLIEQFKSGGSFAFNKFPVECKSCGAVLFIEAVGKDGYITAILGISTISDRPVTCEVESSEYSLRRMPNETIYKDQEIECGGKKFENCLFERCKFVVRTPGGFSFLLCEFRDCVNLPQGLRVLEDINPLVVNNQSLSTTVLSD